MTHFGGIRLFYVHKSYPFLTGKSQVPIFDALCVWVGGLRVATTFTSWGEDIWQGTEIFKLSLDRELSLQATMSFDF